MVCDTGLLSFTLYYFLAYSFLFLPSTHLTHQQTLRDSVSTQPESNFHSFFELNEAIFWAEGNTNSLWKYSFPHFHPDV